MRRACARMRRYDIWGDSQVAMGQTNRPLLFNLIQMLDSD